MPVLYHMSDDPNITLFEPRPSANVNSGLAGSAVWAVDNEHVHNYLLPRDCPRVTFYALPDSNPDDIERLMGQTAAKQIVAIETGWLSTVLGCTLYQYHMPPESFSVQDAGAGYYISREVVKPLSVTAIPDLLAALLSYNVELRITPSLWKLRDAVVSSTLQYSCIRMRNALSR